MLAVYFVSIAAFAFFALIFCWVVGEQMIRTKIIFSLWYVASLSLAFIKATPAPFIVSQCLLVAIIGGTTFGLDWLTRK